MWKNKITITKSSKLSTSLTVEEFVGVFFFTGAESIDVSTVSCQKMKCQTIILVETKI